jgi:glycosyltransferase involved in cell wall biosynthesis
MIYSLVGRRIEDTTPDQIISGVVRFDSYLRRVFPGLRSITPAGLPTFTPADVVIADNHLSLLVPDTTPTIVVHHGCAATHWQADPTWRNATTARIVDEQRRMLMRPNRLYVAPSSWVRDEFARIYGLAADYARVIVNWVPVIERPTRPRAFRPIVLGDWRDENKGFPLVTEVAAMAPGFQFRQLRCATDAERIAAYQDADMYLCLSASEGGSYSMADAEAAGLPIVTTDSGNARDFERCWGCARTAESAATAIRTFPRRGPSFYSTYTFDVWAALWRKAVEEARCGSRSALVAA